MQYKKKTAFTITEIMIVCTIIGVIAVFTMSSFITYSGAIKSKTALKKGCNALADVVGMETSVNSNFVNPDDTAKLMNLISEKMNIKYYLSCSEDNCVAVFQNPQIGYWAINEDNIGFRVRQGTKDCEDKVAINAMQSTQDAEDSTCMSILIDSGCLASTKNPSACREIPDNKDEITSNKFEGSQMRVFMSKDGITFGSEESMAAGIIMAE